MTTQPDLDAARFAAEIATHRANQIATGQLDDPHGDRSTPVHIDPTPIYRRR
jgi:hypothetical protein